MVEDIKILVIEMLVIVVVVDDVAVVTKVAVAFGMQMMVVVYDSEEAAIQVVLDNLAILEEMVSLLLLVHLRKHTAFSVRQ